MYLFSWRIQKKRSESSFLFCVASLSFDKTKIRGASFQKKAPQFTKSTTIHNIGRQQE